MNKNKLNYKKTEQATFNSIGKPIKPDFNKYPYSYITFKSLVNKRGNKK